MLTRTVVKLVALCLLAHSALPATAAADPVVSNVRASQRAGTTLVDIWYDMSDAGANQLAVTVAISTNGGQTFDLPASSFSGSGYGPAVAPGNNRLITWNAGMDWNGQYSSAVRFRITAADLFASAGDYLVVDLSAGPSASHYPVSYMTGVPVGGWTDEYKTTKMVFRRIPAGTFTMGSPSGELGRSSDETQHQVTLTQPFYIGVFEVTQKQWERVMGTWPSYFTNTSYRDSRPVEQVSYYQIRENPANSDDPAVSWPTNLAVNAESFMGRLRSRTGRAFDLPTESQWEYAGRAGTTTALNSGKNLTGVNQCPNMAEVGRYLYNGGGTAEVGSYLTNAWGLYDMHGNVWEWCLDWYGTYPGTVTDPKGATTGSYRVCRGGGQGYRALECRVAFRYHYRLPNTAYYAFGLRVALPTGQ